MSALRLPTFAETRSRNLPSPSDERAWANPQTVRDIAYWSTVSVANHQMFHPQPVQGCGICPQSEACVWCGLPSPECPDPSGHRRLHGESETSWREQVSA